MSKHMKGTRKKRPAARQTVDVVIRMREAELQYVDAVAALALSDRNTVIVTMLAMARITAYSAIAKAAK